MASNYPGALDNSTSLPYPSAGSFTNSPSAAGLNDNQNDAIIATQTKVGTGASVAASGKLLRGTGAGTSAWDKDAPTGTIVGTTDTQVLTNKTLTSPTINSPTITNATITTDTITGYTVANTGTVYGIPIATGVINTAGTINGASIVAASIGTTALNTNAVQANQLATNAITIGYAQQTANQTSITTQVDLTDLSVTVTVPAGGRRIKITGQVIMQSSVSTDVGRIDLLEDGTSIAFTQQSPRDFTANICFTVMASKVASAGSHTYKLQGWRTVGTGNINTTATSTQPNFILVEVI